MPESFQCDHLWRPIPYHLWDSTPHHLSAADAERAFQQDLDQALNTTDPELLALIDRMLEFQAANPVTDIGEWAARMAETSKNIRD